MSEPTTPIPASPALQILCRQFIERFQYEQEQLAKVAFETDKLDPAEGWRFDAFHETACRDLVTLRDGSAGRFVNF